MLQLCLSTIFSGSSFHILSGWKESVPKVPVKSFLSYFNPNFRRQYPGNFFISIYGPHGSRSLQGQPPTSSASGKTLPGSPVFICNKSASLTNVPVNVFMQYLSQELHWSDWFSALQHESPNCAYVRPTYFCTQV